MSPLWVNVSSTVSLVVPGISETIARSSPRRALSRVDLPALGAPSMAVAIPFLSAFPYLKESINLDTFVFKRFSMAVSCSREANSTSSSLKSNSSSIREAKWTNSSRNEVISFEKPPLSCFRATSCIDLFSAWIRSATASA